jgi:hypothetical protein
MGRDKGHSSHTTSRRSSDHRSSPANEEPSTSSRHKHRDRKDYDDSEDEDEHHSRRRRKKSHKSSSRRSKSRSTSPSSGKLEKRKFEIKKIRSLLDRMFFRDFDVIKKGSTQYDDFWKFHEKIQAIRNKGMSSKLDGGLSEGFKKITFGDGAQIEIPNSYSKKHTVTFSLEYTDVEDYIYKLNPGMKSIHIDWHILFVNNFLCSVFLEEQDYVRDSVPKNVLEEFLQTILYFLDFLQKERFAKLKKLRESQAALPIANFQYEIICYDYNNFIFTFVFFAREEMIATLGKHNVLIIGKKTSQFHKYSLKN